MLNTQEIIKRIAVRPEPFLNKLFGKRLLPAGHKSWRVGTRGSLAIQIKDGQLVYFDHEIGNGGGCIGLWMRQYGGAKAEAFKACAAWAEGIDVPAADAPGPDVSTAAVDSELRLETRPPRWPDLNALHHAFWREGVERLEREPATRARIREWRGWRENDVLALARAKLLGTPIFNFWPESIEPQICVSTQVCHPSLTTIVCREFWMSNPVQFHIRFFPEAKWRNGSPLSWIFFPTLRQRGMNDGANAPLVITRNQIDPEQPVCNARCDCVIICAGEWDAMTALLAAGWIDGAGKLMVPPGLAIVGIRGEGRGGTDAYLRHYAHWRPRSAVILADADATGLSWFNSRDGRPCFAKQVATRGAKVLRRVPSKPHKDINDVYRAGTFGIEQITAMLKQVGFVTGNGGSAA
jgi:hypothetical protein